MNTIKPPSKIRISVCIPVYNVEATFLKTTIESVLKQQTDYMDLKVVISDDNSTIDYRSLVAVYPADRVKYHRNPLNLGMVGNWNMAVKRSTGDLSMLLGHDDVIAEGMFAAYTDVFSRHPGVVLCACGRRFIDQNGQLVVPKRMVNDRANIFRSKDRYLLDLRQVVYLCLRNGNAIGEPSAVMFKRAAFQRTGGFNPAYDHAADVDSVVRLAHQGQVVYFKQPYLLRRLHDNNLTHSNFSTGIVTRDRVRLFEDHAGTADFSRREMQFFKASLVGKALFDILRAVKTNNLRLVKLAAAYFWKYLEWAPAIHGRYLAEILAGHNMDAM